MVFGNEWKKQGGQAGRAWKDGQVNGWIHDERMGECVDRWEDGQMQFEDTVRMDG
jgi:hypothetical protein